MTLVTSGIEPGVVRFRLSSWAGRTVGYDVSVYLLAGVLVDTGFPNAGAEFLEAVMSADPRGVVVTHCHEDHAGNVPALAALGLPIHMHPHCEAALRAQTSIGAYRRVVWGRVAPLSVPIMDFDPAPLQLIPAPGHTDDHLMVWDAERAILASGDLFLGVRVRVAHLHESPRLVVRSLRAAAALAPRLLLDPHRGPLENATALLHAKIAWMEETMGMMEALAASGCGEREIQRRVLGRESLVGWASFGEYSKRAFVRAVLREREADPSLRSG